MLFVQTKIFAKMTQKKSLRRFGMLYFFTTNKFRNIRMKIFCFLKIFVSFGKIFVIFCEWSGQLAEIWEDILKLQFAVKSHEISKDECAFVFLQQNNI